MLKKSESRFPRGLKPAPNNNGKGLNNGAAKAAPLQDTLQPTFSPASEAVSLQYRTFTTGGWGGVCREFREQ
jgi:hypothetical protein